MQTIAGKKYPRAKAQGVLFHPTGKAAQNWSAFCPTEYRCYIKEVLPHYATAGADNLIVDNVLRLSDNSPF